MSDLIPPHGGLTEPVSCTVPAAERRPPSASRRDAAEGARLRRRPVDRLPLRRRRPQPAHRADGRRRRTHRVLDEAVIEHDGKHYAWTIPLALPVTAELAEHARSRADGRAGERRGRGRRARSTISDVFPWDKPQYLRERLRHRAHRSPRRRHGAQGRRRQDAPARRHDPRAAAAEAPEFGKYVLTPREVRALLRDEGLEARRRLPDPQPAAPRPRVRPGLRPRDAAPRRATTPAPCSIR